MHIVNTFETVQIEHRHGKACAVLFGGGHHIIQLGEKPAAIRQRSQRVEIGEP
jgi:hypothetical protein